MTNCSIAGSVVAEVPNGIQDSCIFDDTGAPCEEITCDPALLFASHDELENPDNIGQPHALQSNDLGAGMMLKNALQDQATVDFENELCMPVSSSFRGHNHSKCHNHARSQFKSTAPGRRSQERYEQVYPELEQTWNPAISKLSIRQRASNAANIRHSRSKRARDIREQDTAIYNGQGKTTSSSNIDVQREKNRKAAAKCRAKKKLITDRQEELANQYNITTSLLHKKVQDLKAEKTWLRNVLLAHGPEVCECHGIHEFNHEQAQRILHNAKCKATNLTSPYPGGSVSAAALVSPFA